MSDSMPVWITNDFLTQVLRKEEGKGNIIVTNFTATYAVPLGNNYGSTMIRLNVEYKKGPNNEESDFLSLILKAELTGGPVKEMWDQPSVEPSFYYEFIPVARQLIDISFVPKAYNSPRPKDIILEDLKAQGFQMADRIEQLDFDHCRLYMIAAAKLHATSVAVYKRHPELIVALGEEKLFSNEANAAEMFKTCIKYTIKEFAEEANKIERFKKYARVIEESIPHLWDMILEAHKTNEGLKTINQGDPWTTNMMFKYDAQGKVSDIKLLDFQCLRYGSPVNDIVFFIWMSANNDVKKHHLDELYRIYLTTLNNTLEQLNCSERLTHNEFMQSIRSLSPEALYWAGVPTVLCPKPVDFGMFARQDDEELKAFSKNLFSSCANQLPDILESLEVNGVFEYLQNFGR